VLAGKYIDGGTTGQHVADHLHGHGLGVGRHAFCGNAVVSGKHHHLRLDQHWRFAPLNQAQLQRQVFEQAQRARRFGLVVDLVPQVGFKQGIGGELNRRNLRDHFFVHR